MVAAHEQATTHHYEIHYPAHPARADDPHYRDFEHFRRAHVDTARCAKAVEKGTDDECAGGLELHHAHVEFSLQNGVDLAALEAHYPGISNPDEVGAWVESGANLVFLCVLPDVPTLMADGSQRPIKNVHVGDRVITHDGSAQLVTATRRKPYSGKVIRLGATMLTPTHRVLTRRGWSTAAEVS
ncbi:MAG: Hint domain-containing protein, partial [Pseudonocardiaceae bacterium]